MHSCQKIAIIRRNGLGDVLCVLPLIAHCKAHIHDCSITLFIDERATSLIPFLQGGPDEVVVISQSSNKYWSLAETVWRCQDRVFDLGISAKSSPMKLMNFFLYGLNVRHRLAYTDSSWSSKLINCKASFDPSQQTHQALRCLQLVDRSLTEVPPHLYPKLSATPMRLELEGPIVFVSVSNNRVGSTLDLDKYPRLFASLGKTFSVVINCETKDEAKAKQLQKLLPVPSQVIPTATLGECLSLIAASDALFIGDGGLMHLCAALDKPQVVLFGGTQIWEWAPLSDKAVCLRDEHNVNFIPEKEIVEALGKIL